VHSRANNGERIPEGGEFAEQKNTATTAGTAAPDRKVIMRKIIFAMAVAAAGALPMLGLAAPASAQSARAVTAHAAVTRTVSSAASSCGWSLNLSRAKNADHYYRVEVIIVSNPCGYPVEAAATCYPPAGGAQYANIYGVAVAGVGGESFAPCNSHDPNFHNGGYRIEVNGTWQYHTELYGPI